MTDDDIIKYGTDDSWDVSQFKEAEELVDVFKDHKLNSPYDLADIVSDIMTAHGPDGHTDGSYHIALVLWRLLKK